MKKNMAVSSRRLVVTGMLAALIVVFMLTGVGMLKIGPTVDITFLCLPVLIGVMTEGLSVGLLLGGAFGLISFTQAFTSPNLLAPYFMNPLISIMPRLMIPVVAYVVTHALGGLAKKGAPQRMIARGIAAGVGSLTNTVLVLLSVYIACALGTQVGGMGLSAMGALLWTVALTNGLPEAACMALVTPPILAALDRSIYKEKRVHTKKENS